MISNPRWHTARLILGPLGAYLLWNLAAWNLVLWLGLLGYPGLALLTAALLFTWFLQGYVLRTGRADEVLRWAMLRLRPLHRSALGATLAAIPILYGLSWGLGEVWTRLVPVPPEAFRPFESLTETAEGRLTVILFALVAAPILEEFIFRGLVQHSLEKRWGSARAIWFTSVVFALFHALPWVLPIHILLGLVFGYAVYATRSIWAGVVLHAANNSLAALGVGAEPPELPETIWRTGVGTDFWVGLAVLGISAALAWWVAGWLRRAGRHGAAPLR